MSTEKKSFPISSDAGEFSWSYTRHKIFKFCRRAYFYRYYAAQKGWDKFADPRSQLIYRLKNLVKTENYVRNTVSKAISDVFLRGNKKNEKDFPLRNIYSELRQNLFRTRTDIENRCWEDDPKKTNLFEIYYGESPDTVFGRIREYISGIILILSQGGLLSELSAIPYLQWKNFKLPLAFFLDGLNVWTAPDFVWTEEGNTNVLFLRFRPDDESWRLPPGISVLALENKFHIPPSRFRCRTFFCNGHEIFEGYENLEKVRSLIKESSSSMLSLLVPDGKAHEENFGRAETCCSSCGFKEYCEK